MFLKFFSLNGRINRSTYVLNIIIVLIFYFSFFRSAAYLENYGININASQGVDVFLMCDGICFPLYLYLVSTMKRFHDLGKSGGYIVFLYLIPIYNIFLALSLLFLPGTEGSNKYGDARVPRKKVEILPVFFILLLVIIPVYMLVVINFIDLNEGDGSGSVFHKVAALIGKPSDQANQVEKSVGAMNNQAKLHREQGRYEEAESLYQRSLEISEQSLDKNHPSVATALSNLAGLYESQGRYDEAEPFYKRTLAIYENSLGKDHLWAAATLNNLAELYRKQGRYDDAEPLYKRSLEISENSLGKEHPSVATILNNLALLYQSEGRYDDAEPLYKRSLEISENSLDKDDPSVTATLLINLAGLYESQGRYDEAEPLYKRCSDILTTAFPNGHPYIEILEDNIAELKKSMK